MSIFDELAEIDAILEEANKKAEFHTGGVVPRESAPVLGEWGTRHPEAARKLKAAAKGLVEAKAETEKTQADFDSRPYGNTYLNSGSWTTKDLFDKAEALLFERPKAKVYFFLEGIEIVGQMDEDGEPCFTRLPAKGHD